MGRQRFANLHAGMAYRWLSAPLLALVLLLAACGSGGDSTTAQNQARATVLVYIMGTDLEEQGAQATENLQEMMRVGSSPDVNVIVETGGARKEGWRTVKRQKVLPGKMEEITDLGAQAMNEPANLRKFIEWGVDAYPADSYHLVLWDHGGGPLVGVGGDTNYLPSMPISMPQLVDALDGARRTTGVTFDLIGFDTCLMASVEVAYMLHPFAHYMVGSQDVSYGWDWNAYLAHLVNNRDSDALSAGKVIVDSYIEKMTGLGLHSTTQSLIDLGKTPALMESLDDMARTMADALASGAQQQQYDTWSDLAFVRRSTHDFYTSWLHDGQWYDLVDLADFTTKPALSLLGVTDQQVAAVENAFNDAVAHNGFGRKLWQASGLTLYMPLVSVKPESGVPYRLHATLDLPDGLKALVQRYAELALSPSLPRPTLGTIEYTGDIAMAPLENARYSAGEFANLWNMSPSSGPAHLAIKPLDAEPPPSSSTEPFHIAANHAEGWFVLPSADGHRHLVSLLPDDMPRFAADHASYTIPVHDPKAYANPDGSHTGKNGLLQVDYNEDGSTGAKTYRIVGYLMEDEAAPYASRPDPEGLKAGKELYPLVMVDGKWKPDLSRKIITFAAADSEGPPSAGWQLETVTAAELCGADCGFSFGAIDYQGRMAM